MKKIAAQELSLLEVLEGLYPDCSRRTLRHWLKAQRVMVDEVVITRSNHSVKKGQEVSIRKAIPRPIEEFQILYEDPHIVIIDKPEGLLSVPLDNIEAKNALSILRKYYNSSSIFAVHRIDRETSGVLVFAKNEQARVGMDILFKNHNLTREYLALVEGHVSPLKGAWKSFLVEKSSFEVFSTTDKNAGRLAITHYEVIRSTPKCTWLRLILETGRKHQIRVHCKDAGHTILGDKRYGSKVNPYRRLCLHAHRIAFKHPTTGNNIDIQAKAVRFLKHGTKQC